MTVLERKKRLNERIYSCKKPRHLFLNRQRPRTTSPLLSPDHPFAPTTGSLRAPFAFSHRRKRMEEKPTPDISVMKTIRRVVLNLLLEQPSCSLFDLATTLAANDLISELYALSTSETELLQKYDSKSNPSNVILGLAARVRRTLTLFSNDSLDKRERENRLHRKYQLANAFHKLRNTTGSATQVFIENWEDAKRHLSTVLDLSGLPFEYVEEADESDELARKYSTALRDITRDSIAQEPIGLTASQLRFQEMMALKQVPPSISDQLQKEIEAEYRRREEQVQARHEKLRAIEDEAKRKEAKKRSAELMREMTPDEQALVKKSLHGIGPASEIIAQVGTDTCQRGSIQRLQPGQWLNDEVIHYFLVMLSLRDEEMVRLGERSKRSHFFKSFFMTKLMNEGDSQKDGVYEYKNVRRWSKNVPGKDIFNLDKIFFPVNVGGTHWTVVVAFMQEKRIQYYDSLGDSGDEWLRSVFQYIKDEHLDKKKAPLPDEDGWQLVPCVPGTPRQLNGFDCGVFTCMFCDFLSKDCPLIFDQNHVTQCRQRICLSIMNGRAIL